MKLPQMKPILSLLPFLLTSLNRVSPKPHDFACDYYLLLCSLIALCGDGGSSSHYLV